MSVKSFINTYKLTKDAVTPVEFDYGKRLPILNKVTFENSWNISDL